MTSVVFSVPSMNCNHCVHTIQFETSELDGVESVVADLSKKQVEITYGDPATEVELREFLTEINYPVAD